MNRWPTRLPWERTDALWKGALKRAHQPQRGCEGQPKVGVLAYVGKGPLPSERPVKKRAHQPQRGCEGQPKVGEYANLGKGCVSIPTPKGLRPAWITRCCPQPPLGLEETRRLSWAGAPSGRELLSAIVPGAALRWPPAIYSCPFGAFTVPSSNGQTPEPTDESVGYSRMSLPGQRQSSEPR